MIQCRPTGTFSWNFELEGAGHRAALEFDWFSEQGTMHIDGEALRIQKHGIGSGRWSLNRKDQQLVSSHKSSPLTRRFEIAAEAGPLVLRAASAFGRKFVLERSGKAIATIAPNHAFTRRATIATNDADTDFRTLAFAFWLAVLTWRRTARRS
ncbi:MAG: hypothetical protein ABIP94_14410 [Planctomycetota bacterium]